MFFCGECGDCDNWGRAELERGMEEERKGDDWNNGEETRGEEREDEGEEDSDRVEAVEGRRPEGGRGGEWVMKRE